MGLDNPLHIAFLVVILLLVFGARRLPEIGRSLGSGMREFKDSISGEDKQPAQPTLTQAAPAPQAQPAQQAPVPQAADAFGTPPPPSPPSQQAPTEPTHQPQG
ncbi:MAG TPA: twin-arginine translocase TatA/TatE family subunit [Solirubrobacteraceae bacterium]|jgi:sec-independent protein translocase protein TatA